MKVISLVLALQLSTLRAEMIGWRGDGSSVFAGSEPPTEFDAVTGKELWKRDIDEFAMRPEAEAQAARASDLDGNALWQVWHSDAPSTLPSQHYDKLAGKKIVIWPNIARCLIGLSFPTK